MPENLKTLIHTCETKGRSYKDELRQEADWLTNYLSTVLQEGIHSDPSKDKNDVDQLKDALLYLSVHSQAQGILQVGIVKYALFHSYAA